jgi:hypothetical protein
MHHTMRPELVTMRPELVTMRPELVEGCTLQISLGWLP